MDKEVDAKQAAIYDGVLPDDTVVIPHIHGVNGEIFSEDGFAPLDLPYAGSFMSSDGVPSGILNQD
jgi:hypothetical protein